MIKCNVAFMYHIECLEWLHEIYVILCKIMLN